MRNTNKTGHPLFIICVLTLILNDWYFKTTFHNALTGKLSDIAGLFAFPYLLSALFPSKTLKIHIWTGLLFTSWKSEFSQPIIDIINGIGIPVNRTIDFTDNFALFSIFISYISLKSDFSLTIKPLLQKTLIVVSSLSFMATSVAPPTKKKFVSINKEYEFAFSKRELISRLNMVQLKEVREFNKLSGQVDFDSKTNVFHYHGRTDTLALLLDYQKINDQDTIEFKTSFAEIVLAGNDTSSHLKLLAVYKFVPLYKDEVYREKAIKEFEKRIIKEIKNQR
jgi:hypothetical protein